MSPFWLGPLAMGFAGSGHCGAMCGGIAGSAAATSTGQRTVLGLSLNLGRLLTYTTAGLLFGGVASLVGDIPALHEAFASVRGVAGVLLVAFGLALAVGLRSFSLLDRIGAPVWRLVRPYAQRLAGPSTPVRAIGFGALWGFLPCGLVYTALGLAAASGSAASGALTMLAFGAGTLPALLLIGSVASRLRGFIARPVVRATVGLAVALSGFVNIASAWPDVWGVRVFAATTHACCHTKPGP